MGFKINNSEDFKFPDDIKTKVFIPPIRRAKIIKIYDVNTVIIAAKIPEISNDFYRFTVDLKGIKVPSIRSKKDSEKSFAIIAKDYLKTISINNIVYIKDLSIKNNRLQANIYSGYLQLNDWMVKMGFAIPEDECTPNDWPSYRIDYLHNKYDKTPYEEYL